MLCIFRMVIGTILAIIICLIGIIFCLFNPRNPNNVARFAHFFGRFLTPLFGIKLILRERPEVKNATPRVYIGNHQNNFDILVAGQIVQKGTVTVGKKSLIWVPFFGPLYWLTGNILLDRDNKSKARDTLTQVVNAIKHRRLSIWMFPEGTRSQGRGLLPFKTGAFRTAIEAGVPIVAICVSDTNNIKLNQFNNGYRIVEMLPPIETKHLKKEDARELMETCYKLMTDKIQQLNDEADRLNQKVNSHE